MSRLCRLVRDNRVSPTDGDHTAHYRASAYDIYAQDTRTLLLRL